MELVEYIFDRAHKAITTPHHRRLANNKLEPRCSWGMWRLMWLGSRLNETVNRELDNRP